MTKQLRHPEPDEIVLTDVLDALSDPARLTIVASLQGGGERGASEFDVDVCGSTLSHHMKVLREAGVISHRKEGTRCFVSLRPDLERRFPGLIKTVLGFVKPSRRAKP